MSASKHHEILYFDGSGRAEAIRILLHIANVDFTDTRFKGPEWAELKPTTPLGSVPVLKIDDVQHCQSMSLARYAGKLAGWYPKDDPVNELIVDEVMDTLNELVDSFPRKQRDANGDDAKFKELRQEFEKTSLKKYLEFIESWITEKNGGIYCVGNSPTVADLQLVLSVKMLQSGFMDHISKDVCDTYTGIMSTVKAIESNDGYKSYYESLLGGEKEK